MLTLTLCGPASTFFFNIYIFVLNSIQEIRYGSYRCDIYLLPDIMYNISLIQRTLWLTNILLPGIGNIFKNSHLRNIT